LPLDITGMDQGSSGIRQPQQFIFLTPGVTGTSFAHRMNGSQMNTQSIQIDGHNWMLLNNPGRLVSFPPPFEAIEEFKINTAQFSAENPTGAGGTQFTFKSGTDQFHGSLSHLSRNDALNARSFFARAVSPLKLNESAAAFGGPVLLPGYRGVNRTHFHTTLTRFSRRGVDNAARLVTVPTPAFKRGDFSGWVDARGVMIPIYDPASTRANGRGGFTRDAYPNNVIPASQIGRVGRNGSALMPDPTLPGVINNYVTIAANKENWWLWSIKLDHSWKPNQITRFTYFITTRDRVVFDGYPGVLGPGDGTDAPATNVMVSHTSVLSPRIVNEARWSLAPKTRVTNFGIFPESGTEALGIPNHPSAPGITPRLSITNLTPVLGNANRQPSDVSRKNFSFGDTLSWVRGRHQLKFGFTGIISLDDRGQVLNQMGTFTFSNRSTSQPDAANVGSLGHGFASFLIGDVFTANRLIKDPLDRNKVRRIESFVQDDIKLTQRLTLNLGVNYHVPLGFVEADDKLSALNLSLANPGAGGRAGALEFAGAGPGRSGRRTLANTYYRAFAPRFGFAYALQARTVVRGGYGVNYGFAPINTTLNDTPREGFSFVQDVRSLDQGITPAFNINNGFPALNVILPRLDSALKNGSTAQYVHPEGNRPSLLQNWSLGVQRELPSGLFLDVAYVGTKGSRLASRLENINQLDPAFLGLGSLLNQNITSAAARQAGYGLPYPGFTGTVAQSLRPYPQFTDIENVFQTTGFSAYHSLQVKFEKRFSVGLMFLNAYTLSKLIDSGGSARSVEDPLPLDTFNRALEKSLAADDQTHTFVTSWLYELPFGTGKRYLSGNKLAANALGNWKLAASLRYYSGNPIGVVSAQSLPLFGGSNRPNIRQGTPIQSVPSKFDPARDRWLNRDAFMEPAPFTMGSAGRTLPGVRSSPFLNENFSLVKEIKPREGHLIELRASMLNAFNRTVWGDPNSNLASPDFGRISTQENLPRQIEIGFRYTF
jgi:hypothetical protein